MSSMLTASLAQAFSYSGPYAAENWQITGPGALSKTPASGPTTSLALGYNLTGGTHSLQTWQMSTTAASTGPVTINWNYSGYHAYFQVRVQLEMFADGPSGTQTIGLVNAGPVNCCAAPSGGFNYTGTTTINVNSGYTFGFRARGQNFDSDQRLIGTLTLYNIAPTVTPPATQSVPCTTPTNIALGTITDPDDGPWTVVVNWGDGSPNTTFPNHPGGAIGSHPHAYTTNGPKTVTVTVTDATGLSGSASFTVNVGVCNLPPTVVVTTAPIVPEGQQATADGSYNDPNAGDNVSIAASTGAVTKTGTNSGAWLWTGPAPDGPGGYTVTITASDGIAPPVQTTFNVTITNVNPTIGNVSNTGPVNEGASASISVSASDAAGVNDPLSYEFDCDNNGSYEVGPQSSNSASCSFPDGPANAIVTVRVTDGDGGSATGQTTVTVNNVAPTVTLTGPTSANEGESKTYTFTVSDPGQDTWTVAVSCGTGGSLVSATGTTAASGSFVCSFPDGPANPTVSATATDSDGAASATQTVSVAVANVRPSDPALTLSATSINENGTVTLNGTFTDPGVLDTFMVTINWGEGAPQVLSLPAGATSFSASHQYLDDNPTATAADIYAIAVTVTDKDGGVGSASTSVTVNNVAPTVDAGADGAIAEGGAFSGGGSFTDPGTLDTWTATVDYGDGSGTQPLALAPNKSFSLSRVYGDNGVYTVTVTVTDDDGGSATDTLTVTVNNVAPTVTLDTTGAVSHPGGLAFHGQKGTAQSHNASGSDPGSDDLVFTWTFGQGSPVVHTTYNNGSSADPLPSPAGTFPFGAADTASITYTAPGVYTVTVALADDDSGTDAKSLTKLVTDTAPCSKSQGYWKHQFSEKGKPQVPAATLQAYLAILNFTSAVFSEAVPASTFAEAKAVFATPKGDDDDDDDDGPPDPAKMRAKAVQQALAAWLNYASGGVGWTEVITVKLDGPDLSLPFNQAMAQVEAILLNPSATHAELELAKDIAEAVNQSDKNLPGCGSDDDDDDDDRDDDRDGKGDDDDDDDDKKGHDGQTCPVTGNVEEGGVGNVRVTAGDVEVAGRVTGNVEEQSNGNVVIATTAVITGKVTEQGDGSIIR